MRIAVKNMLRKNFLDCLILALLAIAFALNYELFIAKNSFAPAGVNGIATMVEYKTGFSVGYFSLIVNVPLCLFAFFWIGKAFAVKTAVFSVIYSVAILLLRKADLTAFQYDAQGVDTIFPALISGSIGGFVYGIAFRQDSSTGGADIIAKYVSKVDPMLNFFWINFFINAAIAIVSYFVYAVPDAQGVLTYNYKPVCLCMVYCFLSSFVGNFIIKGSKSAYKFFVITSHADEIDCEIFDKLKHSATRLSARGAYSNSSLDVIVCVVNKRQLVEFKDILKKYDNTFAFVETVDETIGNFRRGKIGKEYYEGKSKTDPRDH
ncbi:MAG: hypothetical protein DBX39_00490 [Bacillota bacterium]|nr:MAG: hypothetical protein DBX39_00490 [Bacillota bacterium]